MRYTGIALGSFCILLVQVAPSQGNDARLEFVRSAHRSSVQSIRQLSCTVEWHLGGVHNDNLPPQETFRKGQYWREGDKVRIVEDEPDGGQLDLFVSGNVLRRIQMTKSKTPVGGGIGPVEKRLAACDAFAGALFHLPLPNTTASVSLDKLLDQATRVYPPENVIVDGRQLVVLCLDSEKTYRMEGKWKVKVYLDPVLNHLVRRVTLETSIRNRAFMNDFSISEFLEGAPGLFFPKEMVCHSSFDGVPHARATTTFKNVVVNRPIAPVALAFRFVDGMTIADSFRGSFYRVDSAGNRIGLEKPYAQNLVLDSTQLSRPGAPMFATAAESQPWSSWLPYFFGTVLVLSLGLWCCLRWYQFHRTRP